MSQLDPSVLAQDQLSDKVSDGESKFLYKFLHSRGLKHWDKKSVYPLAEPVEFRSFGIVLYSLYIDSTLILQGSLHNSARTSANALRFGRMNSRLLSVGARWRCRKPVMRFVERVIKEGHLG